MCVRPSVQGSESELKDGASDSDSKVDSGPPEVPVTSDDTPEVLNKALSGLSSRWAGLRRPPSRITYLDPTTNPNPNPDPNPKPLIPTT